MNFTIVLYALMLWQQGGGSVNGLEERCFIMEREPKPDNCYQATAHDTLIRIPCPVFPASATITIQTPFDVPPVEEVWEPPLPKAAQWDSLSGSGGCIVTGNESGSDRCFGGTLYRLVKPRTCADKSRFLLTSEDGKGHCLRLTEKP